MSDEVITNVKNEFNQNDLEGRKSKISSLTRSNCGYFIAQLCKKF